MSATDANNEPIAQDIYTSLAPTGLGTYRKERYDGGGFAVSLSQLAPEDVSQVIQLYNSVKRIYDLWLYMKDAPNYDLLEERIVTQFGTKSFLSSTQSIGTATRELGKYTPSLQKIFHDVRGGALVVLTGYAFLLQANSRDDPKKDLENAVLLARDHAKLMRNAIIDIDPLVRQADESIKVHYIDDFVNKWHGSNFEIADKKVKVEVNCTFQGSITNRCLETSAIDRILYNYINNAARFTRNNRVTLTILSVGGSLVRWVVENRVAPEQEAWLTRVTEADLKKLFLGGLTRGGHGVGLSGCTDFVAASFGVTPQEALDQGYLGAKVIDSRYYGWFHWPAYIPINDGQEAICECGN